MLPREIESYSYLFLKEEGFKLFFLHALWLVESHAEEKKKSGLNLSGRYFSIHINIIMMKNKKKNEKL